jgi:hypothetical protein
MVMKKYLHPVTATLTPDNWKEKINMNDLSLDELITIWGDLKSMEKLAKQVGGFLREVVGPRLPDDEYDSTYFHTQRTERVRAGGLNKPLIEEEMGEDWIMEHLTDPTEYVEIRVTRLEE